MRVLLSTYGSRGDVEPLVALAVQVRALGADVRMCAPPDQEFTELMARGGVSPGALQCYGMQRSAGNARRTDARN